MKYYLTTPIYYVNAAPHIGHTYTTIAADAIRRFKRMQGYDAVLTTGTDEHGQKIERAAQAANKQPREFTDVISEEFRQTWQTLGLAIDRFQRTTNPQHYKVVQDLFQRCKENGYIYKGSYSGAYCVSDELYANEAKPGEPCPLCGRPLELVTEENYYFKLSAFTDWLIELNSDPEFLQPETRRNEVLAFLRQAGGLKDLSISRTTIKWGIPVPEDDAHVFYVWFDALSTYMSAVEGQGYWPADLHLIGKEILRFHAIYWPAFLKAAGLPLPRKIYAHGWLLFENEKMSKSKGNLVRSTPIFEVMGSADPLRYYLLREIPFGSDGSFSYDALVGRYNSDLANGLGNLASRTLNMIAQYRGSVVPASAPPPEALGSTIADVAASYERFEFSKALDAVWALLSWADKYIVEQAPWKLAKDPQAAARLDQTLYTAAEVVRLAAVLLYPVIPDSARKIWAQLGMSGDLESVRIDRLKWGQLPARQKIGELGAVFPRFDLAVTVAKFWELEEAEKKRQSALFAQPRPQAAPLESEITIDDFGKVDLRVGQVVSAEAVKGADKLLHMKVDIGEDQPRTIVAGIAKAYTPEQMVGRKVVIVANLAPRKLRGIESKGMIVAASLPDGPPVLAGFLEDIEVGARLK
jgi:methionyl-tRNA synthetase